uniref:thymidylate synthase n=1 Tax=viral metagenome TaxID=1070528 RepID=A0A6C0BX97_9ZZZZ
MLKKSTSGIKTRNGLIHDENQYLHLTEDILNEGELVEGRNGTTKSIFGSAMHFTLENNNIPILTTKKVAWKTCLRELLWFIKGSTSNVELQKQNVKIWNGNASREFLDSRGLHHLEENDLGPVYGHQWRFFNAPYTDCRTDYRGKGTDQLQYIIDELKNPKTRTSRRLIMSAWNPSQLNQMALPPCHVLAQFNVLGGDKLSCSLYQRSGDVGLGVPFNIASYSFLTHLIAKHCGLKATEFCYYLGNSHIYSDHLESLSPQISRIPYTFPTLTISNKYDSIEEYTEADFNIHDYTFHPPIKMEMRK